MTRITRKFLDSEINRIKKIYKVRIYEVLTKNLMKNVNKSYSSMEKAYGFYDEKKKIIYIDKSIQNYLKIAVLYHELGHHICSTKECFCDSYDDIAEAHATLFSLQKMLEHDMAKSIAYEMLNIVNCAFCLGEETEQDIKYSEGVKLVFSHSIWNDCDNLLKKKMGIRFSDFMDADEDIIKMIKKEYKKSKSIVDIIGKTIPQEILI